VKQNEASMKTIIYSLLFSMLCIIHTITASAQIDFGKVGNMEVAKSDPFYCPDSTFQRLMQEANSKAVAGEYDAALKKCYSAKTCNDNRENEVNEQIDSIFQMILGERDKAQAAEKKANAVLEKIYFFKDRYGLAYDKSKYRYGFIDKTLNTKIDFKYEEALPFDNLGFAKVKRDKSYYLLDTLGTEYPLATELSQLLPRVTALDLRGKGLDSFPSLVLANTQLKVMLLAQNKLKSIPAELGELRNLQSLVLGFNQLTEVPAELGRLQNLQWLDLGGNKLTTLPDEVWKLANLQSLRLSFNQLSALPAEVWSLANLKGLNLEGNQLSALPAEVGNLTNLQTLGLQGNRLTALPAEVAKLANLQLLLLQGNPIPKIEIERLKAAIPKCLIVFK
jgi:Leucine rich repeat/WG containing repeat